MKKTNRFRVPLLFLLGAIVTLIGFQYAGRLPPGTFVTILAKLLLYIIPIGLLVWAAALFDLLNRRDLDIHDKLTWVVVILIFNGLGGLGYFLWCPPSPEFPLQSNVPGGESAPSPSPAGSLLDGRAIDKSVKRVG